MTKLRGKFLFWIGGGLFLLLFLSIAPLQQRLFPAISNDGSRQQRQNVALHIPQSSFSLNQTFVAAQNGLSEVTILLARYDAPGVEENGRLTPLPPHVRRPAAAQRNLPHPRPAA